MVSERVDIRVHDVYCEFVDDVNIVVVWKGNGTIYGHGNLWRPKNK